MKQEGLWRYMHLRREPVCVLYGLWLCLRAAHAVCPERLGALRCLALRRPGLRAAGGRAVQRRGRRGRKGFPDHPRRPGETRRCRSLGAGDFSFPLAAVPDPAGPGGAGRPHVGRRPPGRARGQHRHQALYRGAAAARHPAWPRARVGPPDRFLAGEDRPDTLLFRRPRRPGTGRGQFRSASTPADAVRRLLWYRRTTTGLSGAAAGRRR